MRTLSDICKAVLKHNASRVVDVGDTPFAMIKDVLALMPADQLSTVESQSPHLLQDTEPLWKQLCVSNFIKVRIAVEDGRMPPVESWRELYEHERVKQDRKMRSLVSKMRGQYDSLEGERAASKAFNGYVIPPRRRRSAAATTSTRPKTILDKARQGAQQIKNIYAPPRASLHKQRPKPAPFIVKPVVVRREAAPIATTSTAGSTTKAMPNGLLRTSARPLTSNEPSPPSSTSVKRPHSPPTHPSKRMHRSPIDPAPSLTAGPPGPGAIARNLPQGATRSIFLPKHRINSSSSSASTSTASSSSQHRKHP